MKLTVDRAALAEALAWVARVAPRHPATPALAGVRVTAYQPGIVSLECYDFDTAHHARVPAEVSEPGVILVSAFMAAAVVGSFRTKALTLEVEGQHLVARAGRSTYRFNSMALAEFPDLPTSPMDSGIAVDAEELRAAVSLVAYAARDDNALEELRGVRLVGGGGRLVTFTGQSASIAEAWCTYDTDSADVELFAHLPMSSLTSSLRGLEGAVRITGTEALVFLETETRHVAQRLFASKNFSWERIIPKDCTVTATVDTATLRDAIKRASLTCEANEPLRLRWTPEELTIASGGADTAEGVELVDVTMTGQPELELTFGAEILAGALAELPDGPLTLAAQGPGQACKIVTDRYRIVLMPRRADQPNADTRLAVQRSPMAVGAS